VDLEIINLVKQYGFSMFLLYGALRLVEWAIRHTYNAIMSRVRVVEQGICGVDTPVIVSNRQLKDSICEVEKKTDRALELCKQMYDEITIFCSKSQESRAETKIMVDSMRSMMEQISHDVQEISDATATFYKLIIERLLNGYRGKQNGS
jgi:hypothetical protein